MPALLLLLVLLLLPACTPASGEGPNVPSRDTVETAERFPVPEADAHRWADSVLTTLSLDQKVGQLLLVHLPRQSAWGSLTRETQELVQTWHVGGFLVGRLVTPRTVAQATARLQREAHLPLFFGADYERGIGRHDNGLTEVASPMSLGATRTPALAAEAGRIVARDARAAGVNMVFGPVVDVNNNPRNPIINYRSFGESPELVAEMAGPYIAAMQREGVLATMKHFPGHGNTTVDSHSRMGTVDVSREALDAIELAPFRTLARGPNAPAALMTAHLWFPALDDTRRPATLSPPVLTDLLRGELGFQGLVLTDDLEMGGLGPAYPPDVRAIEAVRAGADILLTPRDVPATFNAVKSAVRDGRIARERLDASVRRILVAKALIGLHRERGPRTSVLNQLLQQGPDAAAHTMAQRAVTVVQGPDPLIAPGQRIALVQLTNASRSPAMESAMEAFAEALLPRGQTVAFQADRALTGAPPAPLMQAVRAADVVVVGLFLRLISGRGTAGLLPGHEAVLRAIEATGKPMVVVTFGNPYAADLFPDAHGLMLNFDQGSATSRAAAAVLRGTAPAPGRLPVSLERHRFGAGR